MLKANNNFNIGEKDSNGDSKMLFTNIFLDIGITSLTNILKNRFGDSYSNKNNANKKLLLLINDCLVYNLVWPSKPKIVFTRSKFGLYLKYELF